MKKVVPLFIFILVLIAITFAACERVDFSNVVVELEVLDISDEYFAGDEFLFGNVTFRYTYADGRSETRRANSEMISGIDALTQGAHTATLTYGGKSVDFEYYVGGTINYTAGEGGYINGRKSQRIAYGGTGALVEAIPYVGYQFNSWSDSVTTPKRREVNVEEWNTITALFSPLECAINYYTESGELIDTQTVFYGELFEGVSPPVGKEIVGYYLRLSGAKINSFTAYSSMDIEVRMRPMQLTVTYTNGEEPTRIFNYGDALSFPNAFAEGQRLQHWEDSVGAIIDSTHIVTNELTLTAVFVTGIHVVSFFSDDALLFEYEIAHGNMLGLVSNPTKDNKTFSHWVDADDNIVSHNTVINRDIMLTAVWDDLFFTATYIIGGGQELYTVRVYAGEHIFEPNAPSRQGYTFAGWYALGDYSIAFVFGGEISQNVDIFAKWQPIALTVKYVFMYGGLETNISTFYDEILELPEPQREAFNFVGWYRDQTLINAYESSPMTASLTLFAKWENKTFGVNILPLDGGIIVVLSSLPIPYGGILSYRVIPDTGYRVTSISANSYTTPITQTGVIDRAVVDVRSNQTLSAQFERIPINISVILASGGSADYSGDFTVLYGDNLSITITPDIGYNIGTVRVNQITRPVINRVLTITNIILPQTVNIQFVVSQHTVTVVALNGTSTLPNNATTVSYGSDVNFTLSANENYYIESIQLRKLSSGTIIPLEITDMFASSVSIANITENIRVEAVIKGSVGTVTISSSEGGSISPSGVINVDFGNTLAFIITPDTGYQVANVTLNGSSLGKVTTYTYSPVSIDGDEIIATFELTTLYIMASVTGNGTISSLGLSSVSYGGSLTYTLTASANHHIDHLVIDGATVSVGEKTTDYTFSNITTGHTIRAVFVIDYYAFDVSITSGGRLTLGSGTGAINITSNTQLTVNHGTALYIYASSGNHISYLSINGAPVDIGGLSGGYIGQITEDIIIDARFELNVYSITKNVSGNGNLTAPDTITHGSNLLIEFSPDEGYVFSKLFISGTRVYPSGNSYIVNNVTGNVSVNIEFVIIILSIGVTHSIGGAVEYQSSVNYGGSTTITIQANDNYHISSVNSSSGNYSAAVNESLYIIELNGITDNFNLAIQFAINTYDIAFNVGAGGHIRASDGTQHSGSFILAVEYGATASYTIVANEGKEISALLIDGVSVTLSTLVEFEGVDSNHSVSVSFATKTYTISIMSMVNGTVTPSAYTVMHGNSVTLTILPSSGYILSELRINNAIVQASGNSYIINNITRNTTVNATFQKI